MSNYPLCSLIFNKFSALSEIPVDLKMVRVNRKKRAVDSEATAVFSLHVEL